MALVKFKLTDTAYITYSADTKLAVIGDRVAIQDRKTQRGETRYMVRVESTGTKLWVYEGDLSLTNPLA